MRVECGVSSESSVSSVSSVWLREVAVGVEGGGRSLQVLLVDERLDALLDHRHGGRERAASLRHHFLN